MDSSAQLSDSLSKTGRQCRGTLADKSGAFLVFRPCPCVRPCELIFLAVDARLAALFPTHLSCRAITSVDISCCARADADTALPEDLLVISEMDQRQALASV